MTDKRTMTLNLTGKEMTTLEFLCENKGLSKTQLVKQALRLYESIAERMDRGDKLFFEDDNKDKAELMVL